MRSEYARTASLRSSRVGVEVVPRLLSVFAHGASDLQVMTHFFALPKVSFQVHFLLICFILVRFLSFFSIRVSTGIFFFESSSY